MWKRFLKNYEFQIHEAQHGESIIISQKLINIQVDGRLNQSKIERETYVFYFVSMLRNLMFFNRRI